LSFWSEKGCNAIRTAIFVYEMGALLVTSPGPVAYFSCYDLMKRLKELLRFAISKALFFRVDMDGDLRELAVNFWLSTVVCMFLRGNSYPNTGKRLMFTYGNQICFGQQFHYFGHH
jgi:hypothetical protein